MQEIQTRLIFLNQGETFQEKILQILQNRGGLSWGAKEQPST